MDATQQAALTLYTLNRGLREALIDAGINEDSLCQMLAKAMVDGRPADRVRIFEVMTKILGAKTADVNMNVTGLDTVMDELEKKIEARKAKKTDA
jgi:hypothetical protein